MLTSESRRRDFPALTGLTYLNTAAESIPPLAVREALLDYWQDKQRGMDGRPPHFARMEECREISAKMLGLAPAEVSFCSCSAEAYNLLASALNLGSGDEVVLNDLDFPSGATPWLAAAAPPQIRLWKSRGGALHGEDLAPLLNERTQLVQISLVSFYNGWRIAWAPLRDAVRRRAPRALLTVDVTQALGRVEIDCQDADCIISSTHKWTLGINGGCIVGIPAAGAQRLTTRAGGWFHLQNAFEADRFERTVPRRGAASFSVGMPNFAAIYALDAALRYVEATGVPAIARHADPLVLRLHEGLLAVGLSPMAPKQAAGGSGILAFQHPQAPALHAALLRENIHAMHHAGRIRFAIHGFNTAGEVDQTLTVLRTALARL